MALGGAWKVFAPFEYQRKGITLYGDRVGNDEHTKAGKYANTPNVPYAATYKPGSVANFEFDITANHKGYLSFYLCDVGGREGDVKNTVAFFKENCHELEREPHPACEAGGDMTCGPIDPKYPGRFVVPCRAEDTGTDQVFGGDNGKMAYRIPDVEMVDAVLITFWMAANSCLDGEFLKTYNYPEAWAGCATPGSKLGRCGGRRIPEEPFSCSDVSVSAGASEGPTPTEAPTAAPLSTATEVPAVEKKPDGGINASLAQCLSTCDDTSPE